MSQPFALACRGGLNVNLNQLEIMRQPGLATELLNFEVDPDGGYRRINGFTLFGGGSSARPNSSNRILGLAVYADGLIACSGTGIFFSQDGTSWLQINKASVSASGDNFSTFSGRSNDARSSQGQCSFALFEGTTDYGEMLICDGANKPFFFKMTGTGGFTIEAVLSGRSAVGIDLDQRMIEGAKTNLAWSGSDLNPFVYGDATNIQSVLSKNAIDAFAGVVLDPPYGRNSQGSIDHQELLNKTLSSVMEVVHGGLALILPTEPRSPVLTRPLETHERPALKHTSWESIQGMLNETGWEYKNAWYVSVHGSLGRVIVHATNAPRG